MQMMMAKWKFWCRTTKWCQLWHSHIHNICRQACTQLDVESSFFTSVVPRYQELSKVRYRVCSIFARMDSLALQLCQQPKRCPYSTVQNYSSRSQFRYKGCEQRTIRNTFNLSAHDLHNWNHRWRHWILWCLFWCYRLQKDYGKPAEWLSSTWRGSSRITVWSKLCMYDLNPGRARPIRARFYLMWAVYGR